VEDLPRRSEGFSCPRRADAGFTIWAFATALVVAFVLLVGAGCAADNTRTADGTWTAAADVVIVMDAALPSRPVLASAVS
jgi:hypothetical protein